VEVDDDMSGGCKNMKILKSDGNIKADGNYLLMAVDTTNDGEDKGDIEMEVEETKETKTEAATKLKSALKKAKDISKKETKEKDQANNESRTHQYRHKYDAHNYKNDSDKEMDSADEKINSEAKKPKNRDTLVLKITTMVRMKMVSQPSHIIMMVVVIVEGEVTASPEQKVKKPGKQCKRQ
jgi:hypothetical protein